MIHTCDKLSEQVLNAKNVVTYLIESHLIIFKVCFLSGRNTLNITGVIIAIKSLETLYVLILVVVYGS